MVLYQKYTYEDACRLLHWEKNEDISDTTKYEDHFTASNRLIAISKSEARKSYKKAKKKDVEVWKAKQKQCTEEK